MKKISLLKTAQSRRLSGAGFRQATSEIFYSGKQGLLEEANLQSVDNLYDALTKSSTPHVALLEAKESALAFLKAKLTH